MTFPVIDAGLNLTWAVLSLGVLLCWRVEWTQESKRAMVAILCVLVLLFPAISVADDVAEQATAYDLSLSPLTLKSGGECKQLIAPALLAYQAAHHLTHTLQEAVGDSLASQPACHGTSLLLGSSPGIHAPPQF